MPLPTAGNRPWLKHGIFILASWAERNVKNLERIQGELKCEYGKYNPEETRDDLDAALATSQRRLTKWVLILSDSRK